MSEKIKIIFFTLFLMVIAYILQSTLFQIISIGGIKPDLSLIILVFISYRKGHVVGEVSGFFAGLIEDFISITPLGFHSIIKTLIGFLYGYIQGRVVIDFLLMPVLFVITATVMKIFSSWILSIIFSLSEVRIQFFHLNTLIEILYNAVLTPLIFFLLNLFKTFKVGEKEKI